MKRFSVVLNVVLASLLLAIGVKQAWPQKMLERIGLLPRSVRLNFYQLHQIQREDMRKFLHKEHAQGCIVFAGDSLTRGAAQYFPALLAKSHLIFAGIDGEGITGLRERMDDILSLKPSRVYIMIGINEILSGASDEKMLADYERLLRSMEGTKTTLFSVLPLGGGVAHAEKMNARIAQMNVRLQDLCRSLNVGWMDLSPALSENGLLKEHFTVEGLHLRYEGYEVWAREIHKSWE